jgi:purine-binding chemotaxis protein CheW
MAENRYVVFQLGTESYGIQIERVERILPELAVTPVPKAPKVFLGIFDLRGETMPALDMRRRLSLEVVEGACNYVVVSTEEGRCAVRVDGVKGIITISDDQVDHVEILNKKGEDPLFTGVGKTEQGLILLLEPNEMVPKGGRADLKKLSA